MPEVMIDGEVKPRAFVQQSEQQPTSSTMQSTPTNSSPSAAGMEKPDVTISSPPSHAVYTTEQARTTPSFEDQTTEHQRPRNNNFTTAGGRLGLGLNDVPKTSVIEARRNVMNRVMQGDAATTFAVATINYSPWGLLIHEYDYVDHNFARNKPAYLLGAGFGVASSVAATYAGGALLGGTIATSSRTVSALGRVASFGARHPTIAAATKGTIKGLLLGTETAKGIIMKMEGKSWGDVGLTLARDFGAFYAFEKGATRAFNSIRHSAVRKNFADKKSRLFIGEAEQEFIWQDGRGTHVIRAKKPTVVENWPGSLNTKPKPRTVGFRLSKSMERMIHAPGSSKPSPDLPDELRFLESEKALPAKLYSDKSIVVKGFTETGKGGKAAGGLLLEEPITLERLSTSSTRASEAARVGNLKREFAGMMKSIENAARATASALGGAAKVAGTSSLRGSGSPRAAKGSRSITKPRVLFETGAGNIAGEFRMGPPKLLPEPPKVIKAPKGSQGSTTSTWTDTGTLFKYWTGVGDVYAEYELTKPKYAPRPVQTPKDTPAPKDYEFTIRGPVPLDFPRLDEPEKQVEKSLKKADSLPFSPLPSRPPTSSTPPLVPPRAFIPRRGGLLGSAAKGFGLGSWKRKLNWKNPFVIPTTKKRKRGSKRKSRRQGGVKRGKKKR